MKYSVNHFLYFHNICEEKSFTNSTEYGIGLLVGSDL